MKKGIKLPLAILILTGLLIGWGFLFWGTLYQKFDIYRTLPAQKQVTEVLKNLDVATGTYFVPWPRNTPESRKDFLERHRQGPFFELHYIKEGIDSENPRKLLLGLAHAFATVVVSFLIFALLSWRSRLGFFPVLAVFLTAVLAIFFSRGGSLIWFHLPQGYQAGLALYELAAWFLLCVPGGILYRWSRSGGTM